jgi:hypothetical protein
MNSLKICSTCPKDIDLCSKSLSLIKTFAPLFNNEEVYSFCADCLFVEIQKRCQLQGQMAKAENKALLCQGEVLEGIDYYKENQFYIFTAWSHLKRGSCCGNNCRHCPY